MKVRLAQWVKADGRIPWRWLILVAYVVVALLLLPFTSLALGRTSEIWGVLGAVLWPVTLLALLFNIK